MKHTNLSLAGIIAGLFLAVGSWFRYFILVPDPDKGLFFGLIGLIIIGVSWNYAGRISLKEKIEKLENTLISVEEWIVDKNNEDKNDNN